MIYETFSEAQQAGIAPWTDIVEEMSDYHVIVFRDRYPVSKGHLLFVPRYNTDAVLVDCFSSAMFQGNRLVHQGKCQGFNIGINQGEAAGQTVMYPHIHLIPRYQGDVANPRGGIRHIIPGKGYY
jgi:diadenosine tetraphosphate (Ap4A) HIT family hydrolase